MDIYHSEGYLPNLNPEFREILNQFRTRVQEFLEANPDLKPTIYEKDNDALLLRFLRAR